MSDRALLERWIGMSLAVVCIICTIAMSWIAIEGGSIPPSLALLAGSAVGALGGALTVPALHERTPHGTHTKPPSNPSA